MPELPEVEQIRRTLEPLLIGRLILSVRIQRGDVIHRHMPRIAGTNAVEAARASHRSRAIQPGELLQGCRISRLLRHGKQLAIAGSPIVNTTGGDCASPEERILLVQLGMTGSLVFRSPDDARLHDKHAHVTWVISGCDPDHPSNYLIFRDPRRFGALTVGPHSDCGEGQWLTDHWNQTLGPDALTIRTSALRQRLHKTHRAVKTALLDQQVLAGVGNIYADEALYRAKIHPVALADSLTDTECARLARSITFSLRKAVMNGGTTLRDFVNGKGEGGSYASKLQAYGRRGKPCKTCGTLMQAINLAQRTTTFCPKCQQTPLPDRR